MHSHSEGLFCKATDCTKVGRLCTWAVRCWRKRSVQAFASHLHYALEAKFYLQPPGRKSTFPHSGELMCLNAQTLPHGQNELEVGQNAGFYVVPSPFQTASFLCSASLLESSVCLCLTEVGF